MIDTLEPVQGIGGVWRKMSSQFVSIVVLDENL